MSKIQTIKGADSKKWKPRVVRSTLHKIFANDCLRFDVISRTNFHYRVMILNIKMHVYRIWNRFMKTKHVWSSICAKRRNISYVEVHICCFQVPPTLGRARVQDLRHSMVRSTLRDRAKMQNVGPPGFGDKIFEKHSIRRRVIVRISLMVRSTLRDRAKMQNVGPLGFGDKCLKTFNTKACSRADFAHFLWPPSPRWCTSGTGIWSEIFSLLLKLCLDQVST